MIRQVSRELDETLGKPDFLVRFAQRRTPRVGVPWIDAAARKTDLPGVVFQRLGTLSQQHRPAVAALDQRHEHGRRHALGGRGGTHALEHFARTAGQPKHVFIRRGRDAD